MDEKTRTEKEYKQAKNGMLLIGVLVGATLMAIGSVIAISKK